MSAKGAAKMFSAAGAAVLYSWAGVERLEEGYVKWSPSFGIARGLRSLE